MKEFFDRTQRIVGLQPRKLPGPGDYAGFHDRVMASGLDVATAFFLFNDLFQWLSNAIFAIFVPLLGYSKDILLHHSAGVSSFNSMILYFWESGWVTLWMINTIFQILFMAVPFIGTWYFFSTSPGKFLVGIEIRSIRGKSTTPTLIQYILRYTSFLFTITPCLLGFIWLLFDPKKQAVHDKIAGTVVVYSKGGSIFRRTFNFIRYDLLGLERKEREKEKGNDNKKKDDTDDGNKTS